MLTAKAIPAIVPNTVPLAAAFVPIFTTDLVVAFEADFEAAFADDFAVNLVAAPRPAFPEQADCKCAACAWQTPCNELLG